MRKPLERYLPKKNSHIHLCIDTDSYTRLKQQAADTYLSLAELCRQKMRKNSQLDRIEHLLNQLVKKSN